MINKKTILPIILGIILLIIIFPNVNAACVIQGYTKDANNKFISSQISGYCQSDNSWVNLTKNAGALYQLSWGGPADTCQSYCNQVYIKAEHRNLIPEEPWLIGYTKNYPMNSGNTPQWNSGNTHWENITLYDANKIKPKPTPIYKPISIVQKKANQNKAIKSFNNVITRKYQSDKLNVNKVQNIMTYGKSSEENTERISLIKEPFWISWWNIIKRFLGVR